VQEGIADECHRIDRFRRSPLGDSLAASERSRSASASAADYGIAGNGQSNLSRIATFSAWASIAASRKARWLDRPQ
jgi:hypothetical protein